MSIARRSALVRAVTAAARTFGYELIPSWRVEELALERHLRSLFTRYEIDSVFDVGANRGQYRDFLRYAVGFQGTIHSFEPVAAVAERVAARARSDPSWHVHHYALGDGEGARDINVNVSSTFSSFLEPSANAGSGFGRHTVLAHRETVAMKRLDGVVSDLAVDPAKLYVKVDTQGFDLEVLRGGREALRRIKAVQFELAIRPGYQNVPEYREVLRQLEEWGFTLSGFFPVTTDERLRAIELDCVMVAGG
jgi:FkbM family methyltransferase